jgi:hypothetical protein
MFSVECEQVDGGENSPQYTYSHEKGLNKTLEVLVKASKRSRETRQHKT